MKKHLFIISLLLMSITNFAQTGFNYKALLTDNSTAMSNHSVTLRFTILENGSTTVYQETQITTTDSNGIVSVFLGEGTVESGSFTTINWENSQSLKVEIDSGSGYEDFGTTEFKAVPYAKYAESGGSVEELNDLLDAKKINGSIYIGDNAGDNDDGSNYKSNTGVGAYVLQHTGDGATGDLQGTNNTAFGSMALYDNTTGYYNTAIGSRALSNNTTSWGSTAIGYNALYNSSDGNFDIAIGANALYNDVSGKHNTCIGASAFYMHNGGMDNTAIGFRSGHENVSGYGNIFIGYKSGYNETGSNKLYIENSDSDTPLIYGEFDNNKLEINGKLNVAGQTTISAIGGDTGVLVINDSNGSNERPGIQFTNNTSQFISGDDLSNELFGFYSLWSNNRTYDALLRVYGKGTSSWGKYTEITHDGTNGKISTDTGDLILNPDGNVKVDKKITSTATGTADLKPFAYGSINYNYDNGTIIINNDTGNFSVFLDNTGVFQVRLYDTNGGEIVFDHENFTVVANVFYNGPAFISFHTFSDRLYFNIYHEGSTSITLPFSFIVYKK